MNAAAPAFSALIPLTLKVQEPRSIRAIPPGSVKKGRRMSRGLWLLWHIAQCRDNFSGVAEFVNGLGVGFELTNQNANGGADFNLREAGFALQRTQIFPAVPFFTRRPRLLSLCWRDNRHALLHIPFAGHRRHVVVRLRDQLS